MADTTNIQSGIVDAHGSDALKNVWAQDQWHYRSQATPQGRVIVMDEITVGPAARLTVVVDADNKIMLDSKGRPRTSISNKNSDANADTTDRFLTSEEQERYRKSIDQAVQKTAAHATQPPPPAQTVAAAAAPVAAVVTPAVAQPGAAAPVTTKPVETQDEKIKREEKTKREAQQHREREQAAVKADVEARAQSPAEAVQVQPASLQHPISRPVSPVVPEHGRPDHLVEAAHNAHPVKADKAVRHLPTKPHQLQHRKLANDTAAPANHPRGRSFPTSDGHIHFETPMTTANGTYQYSGAERQNIDHQAARNAISGPRPGV